MGTAGGGVADPLVVAREEAATPLLKLGAAPPSVSDEQLPADVERAVVQFVVPDAPGAEMDVEIARLGVRAVGLQEARRRQRAARPVEGTAAAQFDRIGRQCAALQCVAACRAAAVGDVQRAANAVAAGGLRDAAVRIVERAEHLVARRRQCAGARQAVAAGGVAGVADEQVPRGGGAAVCV
jgi:hypothetical protein